MSTIAKEIVSEIDSMLSVLESLVDCKDELSNDNPLTDDENKYDPTSDLNEGHIAGTQPNNCLMDINQRVEIAASIGKEVTKKEELKTIFELKRTRPIAYDGFEPSGRMHIAQGILKAINVNKLTSVGCDFVFWIADWFALLNNKMGGDLRKIRIVGEYMIEIWKAAGMDMQNVYFRWCSDDINNNANEYWLRVMDISTLFSTKRTKRCCTILGREESDDMPTANVLYACMQCADIFFLKADICQLGMDQRKVNMLARDYVTKSNKRKTRERLYPPVIIPHPMLMSLKQDPTRKDSAEAKKMSKSDPDSAIFMEDSASEVRRKIEEVAYCPSCVVEKNPIMNYTQHIVFAKFDTFEIQRCGRNGGSKVYKSYKELEQDYINGRLHPDDLRPALTKVINEMIEPVRQHFEQDERAKNLLEQVRNFRVTR